MINAPQHRKRMRIMLISVGILFGLIFLYKFAIGLIIKHAMANQSPVITVSTLKVGYSEWQPKLEASGSLRAIRGVDVTTELAGLVKEIYFKPGASVTQGTVLAQLNADNDIAQLHALQANEELAQITYNRDKAQFAIEAVSKQTLDNDTENLKNLQAQVAAQAAIVAKKTIKAPFTGRLGISLINLGQYLNPGDKVVMLQTLDPMYADFYVPQQSLVRVKTDLPVTITTDAFPNKKYTGKVTTINPGVDKDTRNVEVEATIANPNYELAPGMFATVVVDTGQPQRYITVPQTAISFNPYGDVVYIVRQTGKDKKDQPILTATQTFVTTGETRGDQIAILKGLNEGDVIVTSGQLKLKNGAQVAINNSVVPANNPNPKVTNEY